MSKAKRTPLSFNIDTLPAVTAVQAAIKDENTQTRKRANTPAKAGRAGRQFIAAHVPPEASKQFKMLALQQEKTTQDLLIEAINDLFAKHGLSRIA